MKNMKTVDSTGFMMKLTNIKGPLKSQIVKAEVTVAAADFLS